MIKDGCKTLVQDEAIFMYDDTSGRMWVPKRTDFYVPYNGAHQKIVVSGLLAKNGQQQLFWCLEV